MQANHDKYYLLTLGNMFCISGSDYWKTSHRAKHYVKILEYWVYDS